jgi:nucleotide-binding universal stress UspA family protein
MKRILVPIDFSLTSEKAFRYALTLVQKNYEGIILFHAFTPFQKDLISSPEERDAYIKKTEKTLMNRLQRLKKKYIQQIPGIPVLTLLGSFPIVESILETTEKNHVDLIVMGTRGAGGLKKVILGSTASRVMTKSSVPVLLIPSRYPLRDPKQIVFASGYRESDLHSLEKVSAIAENFGSAMTIVHLFNSNEEEPDKEHAVSNVYSFEIRKKFPELKFDFKSIDTVSLSGTLENLYKEIPFDLLVMVRRKLYFMERWLLGSLTRELANTTRKPLMIIPEDENEGVYEEGVLIKEKQSKSKSSLQLSIKKIEQKDKWKRK